MLFKSKKAMSTELMHQMAVSGLNARRAAAGRAALAPASQSLLKKQIGKLVVGGDKPQLRGVLRESGRLAATPVPKLGSAKTSTHAAIQKLLYALRKADTNGAIDTRGLVDALTSPTAAQNARNLYAQEKDAALIRIGTKLALSIPGAGAIRKSPSTVGRFAGIAGKSQQALQAPGPRLSSVTKPTMGISSAMKPPAQRNLAPPAPAT